MHNTDFEMNRLYHAPNFVPDFHSFLQYSQGSFWGVLSSYFQEQNKNKIRPRYIEASALKKITMEIKVQSENGNNISFQRWKVSSVKRMEIDKWRIKNLEEIQNVTTIE